MRQNQKPAISKKRTGGSPSVCSLLRTVQKRFSLCAEENRKHLGGRHGAVTPPFFFGKREAFFIVASAKINHQLSWWNKKSLDTRKPPFAKLSAGLPTAFRAKGGFVVDDIQSLSHTKWRCQYHIVFAPKYRRKEIYGKLKADIGQIIRKLCEQKGVELIEAEACPDHIHMLVSIPPTLGVAYFMGYLKGKSSLMIFDRHANLKYKYGNRHFWCRGYYVDTVGRNKKVVEEYIKN